MSGSMRWVLFFSVIFLAGASLYALWAGVSMDLLKAVVSFAIIVMTGAALYGLGRRV